MNRSLSDTADNGFALARPDLITQSHQRSSQYGLRENDEPDLTKASSQALAQFIEQNYMLYKHALPVMETLHEQIINTHNMVILTDAKGLILHALGDDDFVEKAERIAMQPGADWSEQSKGTNAVGTALIEGRPTLVHADEHFLRANHFLTCSCSPIIDPHGNVIGTLDVTGDQRSYHKHTMALVRMSAQMIENQLFTDAFPEAVCIHFHSRPELIGTLVEGIIAFTAGGRFLSANRSAQFQLGLSGRALQAHTLSSLFGMAISSLYDHYRTANPGLLKLCMHNGVQVYARGEFRSPSTVFGPAKMLNWDMSNATDVNLHTSDHLSTQRQTEAQAAKGRSSLSSLRYLNTGDPQIALVIDKVNKVQSRDIPILVLGETGTGKELLAQAIHNDSPRKQGPFVAVNCASIPENLIESELFGYEEGAFTGARKKGSIGKMLLANGGTLFLDEIGDMPLNLQARLLRVLQERTVTPLGSSKSIPVNLSIICATNRNLREMIAQNQFREDLYYRLNGLVVKLPPLRERTDLKVVIQKILLTESAQQKTPISVDPEVMNMFERYPWPGNFRQLTNLLRTAAVMAGDDGMIERKHLPDDFLEDWASPPDSQTSSATTTPSTQPSAITSSFPLSTPTAAYPSAAKLEDMEILAIHQALKDHHGNVSAAARALGVSRNTIYRKLPHLAKHNQSEV